MTQKWNYELHIPHGSADGSWRIVDASNDHGDVIVVIDPEDSCESLGGSPEEHAKLIAAAPEMAELLQSALDAWPQLGTEEEMNGGDMVEWFGGFAEQAKALLAKARGDGSP